MKTTPCLYAIVRFCPFVETEEFANVGVIIIAPEYKVFEFKLMTKKHARITNFFEQLDAQVFRTSIQNLKEELERIRKLLQHHDPVFARTIFDEVIRPREAVIKFSNARAVLMADAKVKLDELYSYYVERDFVTPEYREQVLERTLRKWFHEAGVGSRFDRLEVGNEEYHASFPFVEEKRGKAFTVVKPLNLGQDQPSKILDHGGAWIWRLAQLKRKGTLPARVLVTVEGPADSTSPARTRAYHDVVNELSDTGAAVLNYDQKAEILSFVE